MEKETKRLLRKLIRLFDGQTKEYLLKYIDDVSELNIEEQNELAQELPARRLSAEILSDIQRIKNGEEPRFFTKDGQYKGLCVELYDTSATIRSKLGVWNVTLFSSLYNCFLELCSQRYPKNGN